MSGTRRAVLEVLAVVLTGATFLLVSPLLPHRLWWIAGCIAAWLAYLGWTAVRDRSALFAWGLRLDNLREASRIPLAMGVAAALAIAGYRLGAGWKPLPTSALLIFALYPLWGLFQQLFVQALFVDNLLRLGAPRALAIPFAGLLFAAAHLPDMTLTVLCLVAGMAWTSCWLRARNLIPLALMHGWLGALTYYWVLERDPLAA